MFLLIWMPLATIGMLMLILNKKVESNTRVLFMAIIIVITVLALIF